MVSDDRQEIEASKKDPPNKVCRACGKTNPNGGVQQIEADINGIPCEVSFQCYYCGEGMNFWAYGSFQN